MSHKVRRHTKIYIAKNGVWLDNNPVEGPQPEEQEANQVATSKTDAPWYEVDMTMDHARLTADGKLVRGNFRDLLDDLSKPTPEDPRRTEFDRKMVAQTYSSNRLVSTVFLFVDHNGGNFETMVFHNKESEEVEEVCDRRHTLQQAVKMHLEHVRVHLGEAFVDHALEDLMHASASGHLEGSGERSAEIRKQFWDPNEEEKDETP